MTIYLHRVGPPILVALFLFTPLQIVALPFSLLGQFGYQSPTIEHSTASGFEFSGMLQMGVDKPTPAPSLIGAAGLKLDLLNMGGTSLDFAALGFEGGVAFVPGAKFLVEIELGYDYGLYGTMKTEIDGESHSHSIKNLSRINHQWRALYEFATALSIGLGIDWYTGQIEIPARGDPYILTGYSLNGIFIYKL